MSEKRKIPRLGKASGEFNVSTQTIVSLLKKKNIEIADSPNTKLTVEMYDILVQELDSERALKEESQKIEIGIAHKSKQEEVAEINAPQPINTPAAEPKQTEPIAEEPAIVEEVIAEKAEVEKVAIQEHKVIGKIDLSQFESKSKKKAETQVAETAVETTPTPQVEAPVEEVAIEEEVEVIEEPKPVEVEEPIEEKTQIEEEKEVVEEKAVEPKATEPAKEEKAQPKVIEHIGVDVTTKIEVKAVGKINLDAFNRPKKPAHKTGTETGKPAHRGEKPQVATTPKQEPAIKPAAKAPETPAKPASPETAPNNTFIETKYEKLKAPVVKGKIDLSAFQPKESPKKEKEKEAAKPAQNNADNDNAKRKRTKIKHPANKRQGDANKAKEQQAPKAEISQEMIQKQIKETMQRLEPLGKSKASKRKREKRQAVQNESREAAMFEMESQRKLKVTEFITANELATLLNVPVTNIISTCMSVGLFVSINQRLDAETIQLLAEEFGHEVEFVRADIEDELELQDNDSEENLEPRHPIITVMGHVDHGKTSLLDYIRKANVIAGEAGGITQHIGAYLVELADGRKITFLDTPGHEAFTAMRARGAKVTDLCIIVIAADDSVMPQTIEAINHAQAAGVPMVFAITKIDKQNAAPDKIREALANMNILVEDWGGNYQCQEINAKQGTNIDTLLEKVLLEADLLELKANPNKPGTGTVLESSLDKGKGYVAKVLIQSGSMKIGDPILAGNFHGKVKALFNERNQPIKEVGPATPVLLLGLNGAPQAGDLIRVCPSEHDARVAANKRTQLAREMGLRTQKHITLDEIGRRIAIGDFKELNIIVKGDVDGSVEALSDSLLKLSTEQVQVNVIHKSVGQVTESDVLLASASNAIILAFQVRPSPGSRKLAEQEEIDIRIYSIIYTAINEIKDAIEGMHTPEIREKIICNIEIREIFKISKVGTIAGCMVLDGKLQTRLTKKI